MRIGFLVVKNIARGGGIEKYTQELGSRLVRRGHDVTVYSMRHYGQIATEFQGMRIVGVPCIRSRALEKVSAAASATCYIMAKHKHDIVHFHTIPAGAMIWMPRLLGNRCVLQWHGLEWKRTRFGSLSRKLTLHIERFVAKRDVAFTAVSKVQCDYFAQRYGTSVHYIPTGADVRPRSDPQEILKHGLEPGKYILFASRLAAEKGAHYLIPAFRQLNTDCKLAIAGDIRGEDAYKQRLLDLAAGDDRICFLGFVQGRLLEELFSHAFFYVQPSEVEGLSIALLEAMAYGCPCLVSDIPENIEATAGVGWTFRSTDVPDLAHRMDWMLNHSQELTEAGLKGQQRVKQEYSWDRITDRFESFYRQVLNGTA